MNPPTNFTALPPMAGSAIPEHVAICPECGGKLFWNEDYDTDPESDEPPGIDCENEPDLDEHDESPTPCGCYDG